jgi:leader peptidase (prepilin peptidase)/N-methyltransferase
MTTLNILILMILLCATIQDLISYMVYDRFFVALYVLLLIHNEIIFELIGITLLFILLFIIFYIKDMIGGADIKLYIFILLFYGFTFFTYTLILSNTLGCIFCIFTKKKRIPFVPFITLGILLSYFMI